MDTAGLDIERRDDGVVIVRLARPERHNAIDAATASNFAGFLTDANVDRAIRSIVVHRHRRQVLHRSRRGQRPGRTQAEHRSTTATPPRTSGDSPRRCGRSRNPSSPPSTAPWPGSDGRWPCSAISSSPTREARWTHVFTRRGMVPHAGDPYFLARIIPFHRLNEIALLSDTLTSADLDAWGLINRCVAARRGDGRPRSTSPNGWPRGPTRTLGLTKRLYRRSLVVRHGDGVRGRTQCHRPDLDHRRPLRGRCLVRRTPSTRTSSATERQPVHTHQTRTSRNTHADRTDR